MKLKLIAGLTAGFLCTAPAFASTVTLDFEGGHDAASVADFYNGESRPRLGMSYASFAEDERTRVKGDLDAAAVALGARA